ncbi:hypothetical protein SERLA73DRAFT_116951 [Serpula lacrymans var. lacrymans S7.3]|uniref:SET domain-containing protein n=2 Tax=Serpula lacrymans var. lacrymans TaxID=341189 RepID=F8QG56_SERL3|nr:uncharacterized protein SERLADRAFT_478912 [Serpula lacrymans var. lacrymans S7.9]EGN92671.1 hypothetical protein SERLA73DRAFT_116951 [Serpula lacrymans var. lacrymans S7.3]EGO19468.1 hypothetical protein SERLADRAFT_478912 [Serpula lacrymans var. lacrymans S7.9]
MSNHPAFVLQPVTGKGLGIVAVRNIAAGETILEEAPLFTQTRGRCLQSVVDSLASKSTQEKRLYLQLSNCHRDRLPPLLGIFETNALPCGNNDGLSGHRASTAGVFLCGSRFNSSCVPNVNNRWDENKQAVEFRALKDIVSGEELCISYGSLLETGEMRRKELAAKFKFHCRCETCSLVGEKLAESEARRARLKGLYHEITLCSNYPAQGVKKVKLALRLLRDEGLVHYQDSFCYDAFQLCVASSDRKHANAWIQRACEAVRVVYGPDAEEQKQFEKYKRDPTSHVAWGITSRMTLEGPDDL